MRERYIEVFDRISIDCLNGDKYKTGKLTLRVILIPVSFQLNKIPSIQVGTAIAMLVRRKRHSRATAVLYRDFWGREKRAELLRSAVITRERSYERLSPSARAGFPFMPRHVGSAYMEWPSLPELLPVSFPGVKTSRDTFLVAISRSELDERLDNYFDPKISDAEMRQVAPDAMERVLHGFDASQTRDFMKRLGRQTGHVVRYQYRPMDVRWLYWHQETKLLDEKRPMDD